MTIKRDINKLIPPKSRGKKRLTPLSGNRSIAMSRGIGKPGGAGASLQFVETSRSYYATIRELRSASGVFVLQYQNIQTIKMGQTVFQYADYVPS